MTYKGFCVPYGDKKYVFYDNSKLIFVQNTPILFINGNLGDSLDSTYFENCCTYVVPICRDVFYLSCVPFVSLFIVSLFCVSLI